MVFSSSVVWCSVVPLFCALASSRQQVSLDQYSVDSYCFVGGLLPPMLYVHVYTLPQ